MGLFNFIKSNLLKSLEWVDDSKDTLVYKYPMDGRQIQYGSKLTVRPSQVAIFLNKGKIADIFGPGMYALQTSNLPIFTQLMSWGYGLKSPFYADVYFINTKQFTNQRWGTSNP
ncbi:MAG: SPFH domain-containing protein, partial [Clostridia bacterium]|nr:SPFH domain-containing protein [Clostridia bacterium]